MNNESICASKNAQDKVQLHLGCGKKYIPGFIHIDIDTFPHVDYQSEVSKLPMFADNSVDLIYCCHTFEYFDRFQAPDILKEWRRVLKPGGILRLAVPDFENITKVYLKYGDLDHQGILGPLYGRIEIETADGKKTLYHRTTYDFNSLRKVLETAGFSKVERYDWKKTIHKDYDDFSQAYIPHMDKENGILISLNVEATK